MKLVLLLVSFGVVSSIRLGSNSRTRDILGVAHSDYIKDNGGRNAQAFCNKDESTSNVVESTPEENGFLDMANFLEYVQLTTISENSREDAIKFFNVSTAAFEFGSYLVAQEGFGRAVSALENFHSNRKRSATEFGSYHNQPERDPIDIWDPADLFLEFKKTMGTPSFNQLLHLKRKVTMAFVIDSSSSMANDMGHVRKYISQLLVEQETSGADAVYIVTTFADPSIGNTRVFHTKDRLMDHLDNLESKVGGDCEEKTCLGMLRAMYHPQFIRKGNAAMYIFTDAGSKDCERLSYNIIRSFQFCKASAFFILFDSCRKTIDPHYAQIAQRTGGFCLLVRDKAVYNITDTVNGAFESSSLVVGEDTYETNSRVGQGYGPYVTASRSASSRSKRDTEDNIANGQSSKKTIQIDELIESFKVSVTISPQALIEKVELLKPLNGDQTLCSDDNSVVRRSEADNGVLFDVKATSCPCVGNWTLSYPSDATEFTYSVNSLGKYSLSFDAYFVDDISGSQNANYAPCLQVEEYLVIKLNQGSQVVPETLVAKIVGLSGNYAHLTKRLRASRDSANTYIVRLHLPGNMGSDGFRIALEGDIIRGSRFQRLSTDIFYPTTSCFRTIQVRNYFALFPKTKTNIYFELSNNSPVDDVYTIVCSNSENYEIEVGDPKLKHPSIKRPKLIRSNPVLLPAGYSAQYAVTVNAPRFLMRGRTVIVNCVASSTSEQMMEFVRLTEMDDRFYD